MLTSTFIQNVKNHIKNNKVHEKTLGDLRILKYHRSVFFNNLWDDTLEYCRGTVLDGDTIATLPFTKIYNAGVEERAPIIDNTESVFVQRKVNGFLAVVTKHKNEILCTTTGSLDSDFVGYIKEFVNKDYDKWMTILDEEYSYMFECCHPSDPHIIVEEYGMYPLAKRKKEIGSPIIPLSTEFNGIINIIEVEHFKCTYVELRNIVKNIQHEGFVFYTIDGKSAKIKSPYYLFAKAAARKKDIFTLNKQRVEEEYYPILEQLKLIPDFNSLDEQTKLEQIRKIIYASQT